MNIMKMLSVSTSKKIVLKRLKKKPVRPYDLILLDNAHASHMGLSYFLRFCVYVWTGESDSNTLRVDANFCKNGEKNLRFQKYPHTCGEGLT